jgi:hypothetical protein
MGRGGRSATACGNLGALKPWQICPNSPTRDPPKSSWCAGSTSTGCRATSRSSWTATAAGPRGAASAAGRGAPRRHRLGARGGGDLGAARPRGADPLRVLGRELEAPALRGLDADDAAQGVRPPRARATLLKNDIRFRVSAAGDELDPSVQRELEATVAATRHCRGMKFNIALNYSGAPRSSTPAAASSPTGRPASAGRHRRGDDRPLPLHRGPARSRPADPHQRGDARLELPALADRLRRDLGHQHALARLPRRDLFEAVLDYQKRERRYGGAEATEASEPADVFASGRHRRG